MKIALSSYGNKACSHIAPFSDCDIGFVIYDSENYNYSYLHDSSEQTPTQGSVSGAARMLVDAGIEVLVVSGNSFPAARILRRHGIRIYECISATVWEAIQALKLNMLSEINIDPGCSVVWNWVDD